MFNLYEHFSTFDKSKAIITSELTLTYSQLLANAIQFKNSLPTEIASLPHPVMAVKADYTPVFLYSLIGFYDTPCILIFYNHPSELDGIPVNILFDVSWKIIQKQPHSYPVSPLPSLMIQTSGSTGKPRRFIHNLQHLFTKYIKLKSKITSVLVFSPEHISGIETSLSILIPGGKLILPSSRQPEHVLKYMIQHHVDLLACTPTYLKLWLLAGLKFPESVKYINSGGERMNMELKQKLQDDFPHIEFRQAFGTSETTNIRTYTKDKSDWFKPGKFNEDYCIRENLLWLKKSEGMLLDVDHSLLVDGNWICTGDVVETGEDNYIRITGRNSERIISGGEKIFPSEIENLLVQLPFILDAKVYGVPNFITGEMVCADIVLLDIQPSSEIKKTIRNYLSQKVLEYKIPQKINFVNQPRHSYRMKKN